MKEHDATELAYKNGYKNGYKLGVCSVQAEMMRFILNNCCVTDDDVDKIWKHLVELKEICNGIEV